MQLKTDLNKVTFVDIVPSVVKIIRSNVQINIILIIIKKFGIIIQLTLI